MVLNTCDWRFNVPAFLVMSWLNTVGDYSMTQPLASPIRAKDGGAVYHTKYVTFDTRQDLLSQIQSFAVAFLLTFQCKWNNKENFSHTSVLQILKMSVVPIWIYSVGHAGKMQLLGYEYEVNVESIGPAETSRPKSVQRCIERVLNLVKTPKHFEMGTWKDSDSSLSKFSTLSSH